MKIIMILSITTKDWSYGDVVSVCVRLDERASETYIYWGDGKRNLLYPSSLYDRWTVVHHCYNNHNRCEPFKIALLSQTPECVLGVRCGVAEVDVNYVTLHNCEGLIEFDCSYLPTSPKFEKCTHLKKLVCSGFGGQDLNLENLGELEELDCSYSKLKKLNLSRNYNLVKLVCHSCKDLRTIGLSNNSCLTDLLIWDISPDFSMKSRLYLERIVKQNNGIIYDDSTEYVNSKFSDCN